MINKEMLLIRLDRIYKRLSVLQTALMTVTDHLEYFLENEEKDLDTIIYGQETISGATTILQDTQADINDLNETINEDDNNDVLPHNYNPDIDLN